MEEVLLTPGLVVLAPDLVMLALNVAAATLVVGLAAVVVDKVSRHALLPLRYGMLCVAMLLVLTSAAPVWMAAQCNLGLFPIALPFIDYIEPDGLVFGTPMNLVPINLPTPTEGRLPSAIDMTRSDSAEEPGALDTDPEGIDNPPIGFGTALADGLPAGLSIAGNLFVLVWGAVGIWFAGRLLRGLFLVRRLQRSLRPSTDERLIDAARQVFAAAGVTSVARLAESSLAPAPLTLGWRHAVIVVPDGLANVLNDEQLACILAHEAAHVRRRDTLIALMQQFAAIAFWWNPFVPAINRQINRLRERLCDDFAAAQKGHGIVLAQALVCVAEWSAARTVPSPMTSGLLEDGSDLAGRIQRLTEADRMVSSRLSRLSLVALGGFGVLLGSLLLFPMLRADEGELFHDIVSSVTDDEFETFEPAVERMVDERADHPDVRLSEPAPISVTGHVRTTNQKSVAGARVYLLALHQIDECYYAADGPLAVTQTDAEGRYRFRDVPLPTIQVELPNRQMARFGTFQVCGETDGFGIAWNRSHSYVPTPRPADLPKEDQNSQYFQGESIEQDLTLRPARPLTGRIIDDRGRPVENATVQLRDLDYLDTEGQEYYQNDRVFGASLHLMPTRFHHTQTDADGRFELKVLPDKSVVHVVIEHPDFAEQWLLAAITDTPITKNRYIESANNTFDANDNNKPVTYPNWKTRSVRTSPLEIRVREPRQILVEVVHEHDETPAQGVTVSASATRAGPNSEALSSDKTDEQGRAVLKLPPGTYRMYLFPIRTTDDLLTTHELVVTEQTGEQPFKVLLKKGCTLTLQAIDAATGRGIPEVSFVKAAEDGENHRNSFGGFRSTFFSTDDSGSCRAIVTPGVHRYGIEIAHGYPNIDPFNYKNKKEVKCEAGKTAQLKFKLRQ